MKIKEIITETIVSELAYAGNIGMMEVAKFYQIAQPQQVKIFKQLMAAGKQKEAWRLIQLVSNTKLQGDDFVFDEGLTEGGWASTATQGTHITPQLVANVMKLLTGNFIPTLNKFLKAKGLAPTEISAPGGSATYYERDLVKQPNKEYGDVDVQFHIARIPNTSNSENDKIYMSAIKEFCDQSQDYATENGRNVILQVGKDFVQVDLVTSYYENKEWTNALRPEWNVKGVLCNSLYSSLGLALDISLGGGHGAQVKTVGGQRVPFKTVKGTELHTITNKPKTWAVDIAQYFGAQKLSPLLKQYPGTLDEVRVADMINSIKGIAQSLEINNVLPQQFQSAGSMIQFIKQVYLDKLEKAASSSKFDKAASPEAVAKADATKKMLLSKSNEIARLFDK